MKSIRMICAAAAGALALAACGPPAAGRATEPTPPAGAIRVSLVDYTIEPMQLQARAGRVVFFVTDSGQSPHNFDIRTPAGPITGSIRIVAHTKDLRPGESTVLVADLAPGSYTYFCAFPGHEELGMVGTLTVR